LMVGLKYGSGRNCCGHPPPRNPRLGGRSMVSCGGGEAGKRDVERGGRRLACRMRCAPLSPCWSALQAPLSPCRSALDAAWRATWNPPRPPRATLRAVRRTRRKRDNTAMIKR
jgi:hypothetical protein